MFSLTLKALAVVVAFAFVSACEPTEPDFGEPPAEEEQGFEDPQTEGESDFGEPPAEEPPVYEEQDYEEPEKDEWEIPEDETY